MRNLIVISFLFISSVLYSQNVNWDSLVNILTQPSLTFSEIDAFLERKKVADAKRKTLFVDPGFRRVQFDSLIQTTYTIVKIPNKRTREKYYLKYFSLGKKVVQISMVNINSETKILKRTTNDFDHFLENHFDEISVDVNHKLFIPSNRIIIGFGCGWAGSATALVLEMRGLVKDRNKKEILNWCNSFSPEIRYLGGIGLKALKKLGLEMTPQEILILKTISKEKTMIYSCSGCTERGLKYSIRELFSLGTRYLMRSF